MKRPLFWIGLVFLSSTAVFLRFAPPAALLICAAAAFSAAFLAAEKFSFKRAVFLFVIAISAYGHLQLCGLISDMRFADVKDTSDEHAVIQATVTDCRPITGYQVISAYSDITVGTVCKTAPIQLAGRFDSAPKRGDIISCLADYQDGRYVIKHFIAHDDSVLHPLTSLRISVQNAVSQKLEKLFDQTSSAVLSALLVGDDSKLDTDTVSAFRKSSLSHLLVVSGMHLLIISHSVSLILGKFLSPRVSSAISLLFCWGFAALSGFGISIVRAAIMLTVINIGVLIGSCRPCIAAKADI